MFQVTKLYLFFISIVYEKMVDFTPIKSSTIEYSILIFWNSEPILLFLEG